MPHIAHAAGWQVVGVDIIARGDYFTTPQLQTAFPRESGRIERADVFVLPLVKLCLTSVLGWQSISMCS